MTNAADLPAIEELERLYSFLPTDQRDQLLQELLVAAAYWGEAMMRVVEAWLMTAAGQELLSSPGKPA